MGRRKDQELKNKVLSEVRKKMFAEGKLKVWNEGKTKETDDRVLKNSSGGSRNTQFKPGPRPETKGEGNAYWRGGETMHSSGYLLIRCPDHPFAVSSGGGGYVFKHRLVMEEYLGRYLRDDEVVHHKDHNKLNNEIDNLMLMTQGEHLAMHNMDRRKKRHEKRGLKNDKNNNQTKL